MVDGSPGSPAGGSQSQTGRHRHRSVALLLLLPLIGTLIPEFYNRIQPSIGGMPFFYWYQLAWIAGSVACTWVVYLAFRRPS